MSNANRSHPLDPEAPQPQPGAGVERWDVVDQASWESFPASDPPGYDHAHFVPSARPPRPPPQRTAPRRRARRRRQSR